MKIIDLKDKKRAQEIVKELQKNNIAVNLEQVNDTFVITLEKEEDFPRAAKIIAPGLGIRVPHIPEKEWLNIQQTPLGKMTLAIIILSIAVYVINTMKDYVLVDALKIDGFVTEPWRLITPIFLHFGFLHILFNSLWVKDVGSIVEKVYGILGFYVFVILSAVTSNFAQFFAYGGNFGGLSGVLYGLLGLVVYQQKFVDAGLTLPKRDFMIMIGWYFLCLFGVIPQVANFAHGAGLIVGILTAIILNLFQGHGFSKRSWQGLGITCVIIVSLFAEWQLKQQ